MDKYRELADKLRAFSHTEGSIYQGIVKSVDGILCTVTVGNIAIPNVRLRASETDDDSQMLVCPKIGSAVIIGSLSGDLSDLVVLQVDKVEQIIINGGKLGGLVKIQELTNKLNQLIQSFNTHIHTVPNGTSAVPTIQAQTFNSSDYEDKKITH